MATYKRLATILRDVDYKKTYKPTKINAEMFFNILNYAIFNGKLSSIDRFIIRRIRDAFAYYEYDEETDIAQMTFKPKFKNIKLFLDILGHEMVHHYQITHQQNNNGNHNSDFFRWKKKFERMGLDLKGTYCASFS